MARCCHLTSVHREQDVRIFRKECRTLRTAGHEVYLLVPSDSDKTVDGVHVVALHRRSSKFDRFIRTTPEIFTRALTLQADVYHFHDPELIPVGILLALRGKSVIYDVHEDVPRQLLLKDWIPKPFAHLLSWSVTALEYLSTRIFFAGVVCATPVIAKRFPDKKTIVVHNFPETAEFERAGCSLPYSQRPVEVAYVGSISEKRGIKETVRAVSQVRDPELRLQLAGEFTSPALELDVSGLPGWTRVDYLGWLGRAEVTSLLERARAGLVLLHPVRTYLDDSYPVKLFEYMLAGIPVVASDFPLWRQIIEEAECGLLVDPMDPDAIANAIDWILRNPFEAARMGIRGRAAVLEKYTWSSERAKLLEHYDVVLS